ncbi:MAG TPA: YciI family protein [Actinocrinis sp.]|jgi:hypothetical protein|uniref:YciI family protein n=1 Tax=Actinocrinis sp. TaxID=1920516 RepID=UPI002DDCE76D|nr:YciI family protein [Actinocrinis sp.]HEV3168871.1 YciI family protein [Actinocrinis sp.]
MKYMMFICHEPERLEEASALVEKNGDAWLNEMVGRGVRLDGNPLRPPNEATTLRMRDGKQLLIDGPFTESKEAIAGFDIIDCADLDEAIEIASKHPCAGVGSIELRPFWPQTDD